MVATPLAPNLIRQTQPEPLYLLSRGTTVFNVICRITLPAEETLALSSSQIMEIKSVTKLISTAGGNSAPNPLYRAQDITEIGYSRLGMTGTPVTLPRADCFRCLNLGSSPLNRRPGYLEQCHLFQRSSVFEKHTQKHIKV